MEHNGQWQRIRHVDPLRNLRLFHCASLQVLNSYFKLCYNKFIQLKSFEENDLGFIVGNRLMILIEEQSVWTINILIRILIFVDVKAKIIYDGKKGDIINQNVSYTRVFDEQIKKYGKTKKAVTETIRICRDRDVLKNYLIKEEVPDIMFAHLDKEQQMEYVFEQGHEQGLQQGIEDGQIQTLIGLTKKNYITIDQAAEEAGMSVEEFLEKMRLA